MSTNSSLDQYSAQSCPVLTEATCAKHKDVEPGGAAYIYISQSTYIFRLLCFLSVRCEM